MRTNNSKEQEEYLYIVLVRALTGLGKLVRRITRYEYTHIAICLDESLTDFITFSRRKHYAPFDAGFMHETRDCYAFGQQSKVKLKVFRIPVAAENMQRIRAYIDSVQEDEEYLFNLFSMVTMPVLHGFPIYKTHNCMSFTGKILELSNSVTMDRKYYRYSIRDIDLLLADCFYKEEYVAGQGIEKNGYMEKVGFGKNMVMFFQLIGKLMVRVIIKGKNTEEII